MRGVDAEVCLTKPRLRGDAGYHRASPTNVFCSAASRLSAARDSGPLLIERAAYSRWSSVEYPTSTVDTASLAIAKRSAASIRLSA